MSRNHVLKGVGEATRLHQDLDLKTKVLNSNGYIDVFKAALELDVVLLFQKLEGILGAYLVEDGVPGILVTNQRSLGIQRFTAAHELGHFFMNHNPSLDSEKRIKGSTKENEPQEIEANAFASEFLSPRWLISYHAKKQNWNKESLSNPINVYQLSLRMGMSFDATCRSLFFQDIISWDILQTLLATPPKTIKRSILPSDYTPENWWGDVWLLSEKDEGAFLTGQPKDLFVLRVKEKSGSGYVWSKDNLDTEGIALVHEYRESTSEDQTVGGDCYYQITLDPSESVVGELNINQIRPWQPMSPLSNMQFSFDIRGKETLWSI